MHQLGGVLSWIFVKGFSEEWRELPVSPIDCEMGSDEHSYCWCFRNPCSTSLSWTIYKSLVNNGINYQPQLVFSPDFYSIPSTSISFPEFPGGAQRSFENRRRDPKDFSGSGAGEDITPGGTICLVGGGCFKDMHLFIPNWNWQVAILMSFYLKIIGKSLVATAFPVNAGPLR